MANLTHLKALRESRGLTQDELAERAGVSVAAIRKHEQGAYNDAKLSFTIALADALGTPIQALFVTAFSHEEIKETA